jgi:hypothetical protein
LQIHGDEIEQKRKKAQDFADRIYSASSLLSASLASIKELTQAQRPATSTVLSLVGTAAPKEILERSLTNKDESLTKACANGGTVQCVPLGNDNSLSNPQLSFAQQEVEAKSRKEELPQFAQHSSNQLIAGQAGHTVRMVEVRTNRAACVAQQAAITLKALLAEHVIMMLEKANKHHEVQDGCIAGSAMSAVAGLQLVTAVKAAAKPLEYGACYTQAATSLYAVSLLPSVSPGRFWSIVGNNFDREEAPISKSLKKLDHMYLVPDIILESSQERVRELLVVLNHQRDMLGRVVANMDALMFGITTQCEFQRPHVQWWARTGVTMISIPSAPNREGKGDRFEHSVPSSLDATQPVGEVQATQDLQIACDRMHDILTKQLQGLMHQEYLMHGLGAAEQVYEKFQRKLTAIQSTYESNAVQGATKEGADESNRGVTEEMQAMDNSTTEMLNLTRRALLNAAKKKDAISESLSQATRQSACMKSLANVAEKHREALHALCTKHVQLQSICSSTEDVRTSESHLLASARARLHPDRVLIYKHE